jgi:branched-subunit amino acid ABC-type transport system permease component
MFLQHVADGLLSGAVIGLGAIGLSFTMKILRFANFSHSELNLGCLFRADLFHHCRVAW